MVEPVTLAAAAVGFVAPYLAELGEDAAKAAAAGVGKSAWDWIKGRLTSAAGKEAVADLESAPGEALNRRSLEVALAKYLTAEPASAADLAKLLEAAGVSAASQTMNTVGDGNASVQAAASTVTITR